MGDRYVLDLASILRRVWITEIKRAGFVRCVRREEHAERIGGNALLSGEIIKDGRDRFRRALYGAWVSRVSDKTSRISKRRTARQVGRSQAQDTIECTIKTMRFIGHSDGLGANNKLRTESELVAVCVTKASDDAGYTSHKEHEHSVPDHPPLP